jgi:protein-S-isoprenylcysteine O-methyltransferase Ste14
MALALLLTTVTAAFLRRIRVEEDVLSAVLGEPYRDYMRHTQRLIPAVY